MSTAEIAQQGALGGFIGFVFAYVLARIQRRWDMERAAKTERLGFIQAARIPLEIMRDEISTSYQLHSYFNSSTEEQVLKQVREALYALRDEQLAQFYEKSKQPLHEFAYPTLPPTQPCRALSEDRQRKRFHGLERRKE